MSEFDNNLPGGEWLEYDAACMWCVQRGIYGNIGDPLPESLSARAIELINFDRDAFAERIRSIAYADSMNKAEAAKAVTQ